MITMTTKAELAEPSQSTPLRPMFRSSSLMTPSTGADWKSFW